VRSGPCSLQTHDHISYGVHLMRTHHAIFQDR
jgi:hypothetical protein